MRTKWFFKFIVLGILLAVLSFGVSAVLAVPLMDSHHQPPPPPPTSTPPLPPTPADVPAPAPSSGNGGTGFLAILEGFVWEDGDPNRPAPDFKVRYTSDGVSLDATTNNQGFFRFRNVGPDGGVLETADDRFQSGTGGVVVKPPLGLTIRVNLAALPKGKLLTSPVKLEASVSPAGAAAGQTATFTFKVKNGTQGVVSGLMLAWQLPDGLAVSGVKTSRGDVLSSGPHMIAVDLNTLAGGDSATVEVVALAKDKAVSQQDVNRATLLYREGPAISAQTAGGSAGGPATLPITGLGVPVVAILALVSGLILARRLRLSLAK